MEATVLADEDKRAGRRVRPYTTGEIARELGVHVTTVIKMLERGELPFYWSRGRGRRLVRSVDWDAWKAKH